ncbi:MAG: HD domain-containing protein [Myxococcales bacterium]|nr:HD domain-containing protein [Myxococcales bacterium]
MTDRFVLLRAAALVRIAGAEPAHDALHVERVMASARRIAAAERADVDICVAAALLHELFNYPKSHRDSSRSGDVCADHATALLREHGFDEAFTERVAYCIRVHSFSRGIMPDTLEAKVLQDADRLDAIGAIGIARCFATSADMKRPFYAPADPFCRERSPDDKQWGIDHFYKKLLRIGDGLHTATARTMAAERIAFMRAYLDQLEREVAGVEPPPK